MNKESTKQFFGSAELSGKPGSILKNATPQQIGIYATLIITILTSAGLFVGNGIGFLSLSLLQLGAITLLVLLVSYFIIIYALKNYIYRRIKLIYKNIYQTKMASKAKAASRINLNTDIITEVNQEVSEWADSKVREIENLRKLEEYRRNFLGDISHELKTPIFNIQGYIHTLIEGGLYDEQINEKYLRKAAANVDRLQVIIEDLDAISKLESGEWVLEMKTFNIKLLTDEVIEDLEIMAIKKGVKLSYKDGANRNFSVKGDRENIRQVLVNLISNSIKYGRPGGHTKVSFYDMDKRVLIEVADDGIGMEEKHLNHIFDRFYRVDKSRSRSQGGSGLGLAIVKHIIEAHQQTINVRSSPGLGATFGFTLEKAKA